MAIFKVAAVPAGWVFAGLLAACSTTPKQEPVPEENRFKKVVLAGQKEGLTGAVQFDFGPDGRIYLIEMAGSLKIYTPQTRQLKTAGFLETHDGGEHGLISLRLDPGFQKNGYVYLQYFIKDTSRLARTSRFTLVNDSLDLQSEKVYIEVPYDHTCCHTGGGMDFDSKGNLYVSTGDNSEAGSGWTIYSPMDDRPGKFVGDALRSAGNTNDYRGKILRIHPENDGTYTIPEGNLFPKGTENTKPEIYAMGLRNPYRLTIDTKTDYLYWGEVGPDAGQDSTRGPRGYDEFNQARAAGNFGWPLFIGPTIPYPHVYYAENERIGALSDSLQPVNFSLNNTGIKNLPPPQRAFIAYPYASSEAFPSFGAGGRTAVAGPIYHYDPDLKSDVKFPKYFDHTWFIGDWMRNWINTVHLDANSNMEKVESFMPGTLFRKPVYMKFGPDGALYILEYGSTWSMKNPDLQLVKIEFIAGNRPPIPHIQVVKTSGDDLLTLQVSAAGSVDHDGDSLEYIWNDGKNDLIGNGYRQKMSFAQPGKYTIKLTVKDEHGAAGIKDTTIWVGIPEIKLVIPNRSFYWDTIRYVTTVEHLQNASEEVRIDTSLIQVSMQRVITGNSPNSTAYLRGEIMVNENDCKGCHQLDRASAGPAFQEIANKYKNHKEEIPKLAQKIISGGGGVWGSLNMSAHPNLDIRSATAMVEYIYSLANERSAPVKLPLASAIPASVIGDMYLLKYDYVFQKGTLANLQLKDSVLLRSPLVKAVDFENLHGAASIDNASFKANPGAYFCIKQVDLTGVTRIQFSIKGNEGRIEMRVQADNGPLLGTLSLEKEGEQVLSAAITPLQGKQDIYFVFLNERDEWGRRSMYMRDLLFRND